LLKTIKLIDNIEFNTYKELKNATKIKYRGYLMRDILATDYIYFAYKRYLEAISVKNIFLNLMATPDLKAFKKELSNNCVLFTSSNYGKDHRKLLDSIVDDVNKAIIINKNSRRLKFKFDINNIIISFWQIFAHHKTNTSFITRLFFFSKLVYYKNFIDELEKINYKINIKSYVSFLSCMTDDSIYCQFFKKRGVLTYCIQHGAYASEHEYKKKIPMDVVNIENFQADYMLGWGDSIRSSMIKQGFLNEQFILAGNPKYKNIKNVSLKKPDFKKVVVCLARDFYMDENIQLLEIASKLKLLGIKVFIKYHPRSIVEKYAGVIGTNNLITLEPSISLNETISQYQIDFAIVYNSTVYYEFYILGMIPFRFILNENDILFGLDDGFTDYQGLINKIEEFKLLNYTDLSVNASVMVNRFSSLGINNYKKILC